MEFTRYDPRYRWLVERLAGNTLAGEQRLGYPRFGSYPELEKEYGEYPDSSMDTSAYVILRGGMPVGLVGVLQDADYLAVWGPLTNEEAWYRETIRESLAFLRGVYAGVLHIFPAKENTVYCQELEEAGGALRSVQHVMRFTWPACMPEPRRIGEKYRCFSPEELSQEEAVCREIELLLEDGFHLKGQADSLLRELLRDGCSFLCCLLHGRTAGVLVWNENFVREIRIEYLAVEKDSRRVGVASNLLGKLLRMVSVRYGRRSINLTHGGDNLAAHALYVKNGFDDEVVYREFVLPGQAGEPQKGTVESKELPLQATKTCAIIRKDGKDAARGG